MKKLTFEDALQQLQQTVEKLEHGDVTLNESLKLYEKGTRLSAYCADCLKKAQQKITELESDENDTETTK